MEDELFLEYPEYAEAKHIGEVRTTYVFTSDSFRFAFWSLNSFNSEPNLSKRSTLLNTYCFAKESMIDRHKMQISAGYV